MPAVNLERLGVGVVRAATPHDVACSYHVHLLRYMYMYMGLLVFYQDIYYLTFTNVYRESQLFSCVQFDGTRCCWKVVNAEYASFAACSGVHLCHLTLTGDACCHVSQSSLVSENVLCYAKPLILH